MVCLGLGTKTTWGGLEKILDNLRMKQKQQGNLAKYKVNLGVKPLHSLVIRQKILLHLFSRWQLCERTVAGMDVVC